MPAAILRELARGELSREEEMLVLDSLASDALTFGDADLRSHLDEWSQRALQRGPEVPAFLCTRGAVLVALGRHQDGKALLTSLQGAGRLQPLDSLISKVFLARAEHALGNTAAARRLADEARTMATAEPVSPAVAPLLAQLEAELAAPSQPRPPHDHLACCRDIPVET
jgi:predicted Zn-dependent protease